MLFLMLVLAAILTMALGLWLLQSVWYAAIAKLPPKFQDELMGRYAIDPYMWTEPSFRPLRRRYVISNALIVLSFALWALVGLRERADVAIGFGLVAAIGAFFLFYRLLRHGL